MKEPKKQPPLKQQAEKVLDAQKKRLLSFKEPPGFHNGARIAKSRSTN